MRKILLLVITAVLLACCGKEPTTHEQGIEMGAYSAQTLDGSLYAEFIGENSFKLYFNGYNPTVWYYKI